MNWYKDFTVEKIEKAPISDDPSAERKNLLLGVPVFGIRETGVLDEKYRTDYYNTRDTSLLTDGGFAETADYLDKAYFHITRGIGRLIVFRLPCLCAVDNAKIHSLHDDTVGICLTRRATVMVSENGVDWQVAGRSGGNYCEQRTQKAVIDIDFSKIKKALYVAFRIDSGTHVWLDEIELFGTTAIPENAEGVTPEDCMSDECGFDIVDKYPDPQDFFGIHNLLLSYNCVVPEKVGENKLGYITEEQYLPYVAYIKDGGIKDTMFDAFLYLPYSVYTYSKLYKSAEGWKYYLDNLFADGYNLKALDSAAAKTGKALGDPGYKVPVFFSVFATRVFYGDFPEKFGDIDGDGADEDLSTWEGISKSVKWFIDEQIARYKAADCRHCELKGFYWFEEKISYSERYELKAIKFVRDYLHSMGYKLFWIPYFEASGFEEWKSNGFDIACMQPNYAFSKDVPVQRLYDNAELTKKLGMCYEMEIGGFDDEHIEKFRRYMDCGAETGYMKSIKMYYQGGVPGEFYKAYIAEEPEKHALYDELYLYCKEKYVSRGKERPER